MRIRRGKRVEIPEKWLGVIPTSLTKRKRRMMARLKVLSRKRRVRLSQEKYDYEGMEP